MRILVLDGNQNQAVACVRSLAQAGHDIRVGESTSWSKAGLSRYCRGTFRYPSPQADALEFVKCIAEIASAESGTFVLPATDATTLPLSAHREAIFAAGARIVLPEHADLLRALDKEEATRLACSLGIPVPKTVAISGMAEAERVSRSMTYPVVLKARTSTEYAVASAQVRMAGRPRYARNGQEFISAFQQLGGSQSPVLAQEFVEGTGLGYFALMRHGEVLAEFAHRRIRDVYPSGSGSALRVSVELEPQIREAGRAILRALHWHGVAMVEFRWRPGERPVFMEVNGRLWHSLALACYAGADFPTWLLQLAERGDMPAPPPYRTGVHCRWWLGDLRHLVEVWRGAPPGYPGEYPSRLGTLFAEMRPVRGAYHDNFSWRDPLPELGDWLSLPSRMREKRDRESRHA